MPAPLVDLRVARTAARLVLPRQQTTPGDVTDLRLQVARELPAIDAAARRWTMLGAELPPTTARVVGRAGWVDANLQVLVGVIEQVSEHVQVRPAGGAQLIGAQLGTLLGLLSTRVLGQFILPLAGGGGGELVVVGPNVLDLGRRSPAIVADLRRTVLLHEVAHRLQFDGVPWLGDHLRALVSRYVTQSPTDAASLARLVTRLPQVVGELLRGGGFEAVLQGLLSPDQARTLDEAQALMSLLEGHGNATMHLAAEEVVDDPEAVTAALAERRGDLSAKLLRTVAGLERKERQYSEGEAFVRHVVDARGVEGLNRAFRDAASLPQPGEIVDPTRWLDRIAA